MSKFSKIQARARGAFTKGVNGVTGALNKVSAIANSFPREISSGSSGGVVGLANAVGDARSALTGLSMGSG